jgi:aldehyde:ferredoxin oxidoreductase
MLNENYIKVLNIDLTTGRVSVDLREDLMKYLGGVGVASKLLLENMVPGEDPLSPGQPIIFAIGAISSIFPVVTKTVAMFISPVTGELGESYAGGRFAYTMFNAGIDALVIKGMSLHPCYISINNNRIDIKDARAFWGLHANQVGQYIRTVEGGQGKRSIIRIGPAGENLCKIANVNVDTYRHFGRMGLGAIFGSKNLKAIQVTGDVTKEIKDQKKYLKVYNEIFNKVTDTKLMTKYHDLGTPINVNVLNIIGALPVKNLQQAHLEDDENISGEHFAERNLVRKIACVGCPVGCVHIGQVRREFDVGHEYETLNVAYDYELIATLGSDLGITDSDSILELIDAVEEYGLDAVAGGICLAYATECFEKKIITEEQTIVPLAFGNKDSYLRAIKYMAAKENDFYAALSDGVAVASKKYGGEDFAVSIAKNEMPAYHTGYGAIVGYSCGARHSHLCNGGYSYDQAHHEFNKQELVDSIFDEEVKRCVLNSLIICLFARNVYDNPTILSALDAVSAVAPENLNDEYLEQLGLRIYKTKLLIKQALGFDLSKIQISKRVFTTPAMGEILDEGITREMIEMFKKKDEELLASDI